MNLLKIFSIQRIVLVLAVAVAIAGAVYFWRLNGKNLVFCATKSEQCQLARLTYQKEVAQKVADLSK